MIQYINKETRNTIKTSNNIQQINTRNKLYDLL